MAEVHDGKHVIESVKSVAPAVLVLDLMLPNRNGFELLKELKENPDFQSLSVLMLTAKGQQRDKITAQQLGVDAFITKPFSNRDVLDCVNRLAAF